MSDLEKVDNSAESALVGTDRDGAQIAESLLSGANVVIVGQLGSGKSHLMRDVVARLRREGLDPLILRPGGPLSRVPLGTLEAASDPRAEHLRVGSVGDGPRPLVVVDDAHELDDDSAAALVRAIYGARATALFALTVSRDGGHGSDRDGTAAQMIVDLWLRGLAERVDLSELRPPDADDLLTLFGGNELDALTRASVIGLADGSRMLLREFTREALTAAAQGRDPIAAIRDARPHGRLADVMAAHVAQSPADERTALAILGKVPRIAFADAVRLVPVDVIERLIAERLVHDDGTVDRLLTANAALARAAERASDSHDIDAALARAATRMLAPDAGWWSVPIARRIASMWLRSEPGAPHPDTVAEATRVRVALDAARTANDTGEHDLAASFARWGTSIEPALPLRIELAFADAGRGAPVETRALIEAIGAARLDSTTMLRWVRMSAPLLIDLGPATRELIDAAVAAAYAACTDPVLVAELDLIVAQTHAVSLEWEAALAQAIELTSRVGVSASVRMRAAVLAGLCQASLGDSQEAQRWFLRARRLAGDRDGTAPTTTQERLWAASSEVLAHGVAGTDARGTLARLDEEYTAAALEGDPTTGTFVGLIAAAAAASIGDVDRAVVELRSGVRRAHPPQFATLVAYVEMIVARALALQGRAGDARTVLDLADTTVVEGIALLDHARLSAETCVLAAEGRDRDAVARAREASAVSVTAPALRARDLFQLLALGATEDEILPQMRAIAESTSVPVTRVLNDRALELVSGRSDEPPLGGFEAMRMGAVWGVGDGQREWMRRISLAPRPSRERLGRGPGQAMHELTRREREIALLVAEGLSNREIATRLYLSVRTVESHIYQARAKVDALSRGELGRMVAQSVAQRSA